MNVSISARATSAFSANRDVLVLSASWQGPAIPARESEADEMGDIDLGREEIRLPPQGGRATFTGSSFKHDRAGSVLPGTATINVNVMSAIGEGAGSGIHCTPAISGPQAQIAGKTHDVRCALFAES